MFWKLLQDLYGDNALVTEFKPLSIIQSTVVVVVNWSDGNQAG